METLALLEISFSGAMHLDPPTLPLLSPVLQGPHGGKLSYYHGFVASLLPDVPLGYRVTLRYDVVHT